MHQLQPGKDRSPTPESQSPSRLLRSKRPLALLGAGLVLFSFGLMWGLPNLFDFAQDSVVPYGTLAQRGFEFEQVTTFRYPPFHFWVLRVCFLPARALLKIPSLGENAKTGSTLFILSARLVSLSMALGTIWLLYAVGRKLWDESTGLAGALIFMVSPVTLYYAKNANLDIPYTFWLAAALFFYVRILQENRQLDYLWLGVAAALAVCTKDQAYGFLLLMPLPMLVRMWTGKRQEEGPAGLGPEKWKRIRLALVGFLVPFVFIHDILFDPLGFWRHIRMILGPASEGWREFSPGLIGQLRLLVETVLRLMDAWTPAGVALVVMGLALAARESSKRRGLRLGLLVAAASYYVSFLALVGYVYPRFALPMMLVLSPFGGHAAVWLWRQRGPRARWTRTAAVAILAWVALAGLSLDYVMSNYSRYDAQMWLERNASADMRICYIGDMRDMPRFNKPLDPQPCRANERALAREQPDLVVLSLENGHPADRSGPMRIASLLRRNLGEWGRLKKSREGSRGPGFMNELLAGGLGYQEIKRFEPAISAFVPDVAESVNRTIVIMAKEAR